MSRSEAKSTRSNGVNYSWPSKSKYTDERFQIQEISLAQILILLLSLSASQISFLCIFPKYLIIVCGGTRMPVSLAAERTAIKCMCLKMSHETRPLYISQVTANNTWTETLPLIPAYLTKPFSLSDSASRLYIFWVNYNLVPLVYNN